METNFSIKVISAVILIYAKIVCRHTIFSTEKSICKDCTEKGDAPFPHFLWEIVGKINFMTCNFGPFKNPYVRIA